jgi:hypothetical protein
MQFIANIRNLIKASALNAESESDYSIWILRVVEDIVVMIVGITFGLVTIV